MIHPAKTPIEGGFDLQDFAPSMDADAAESLGKFLDALRPECEIEGNSE